MSHNNIWDILNAYENAHENIEIVQYKFMERNGIFSFDECSHHFF